MLRMDSLREELGRLFLVKSCLPLSTQSHLSIWGLVDCHQAISAFRSGISLFVNRHIVLAYCSLMITALSI